MYISAQCTFPQKKATHEFLRTYTPSQESAQGGAGSLWDHCASRVASSPDTCSAHRHSSSVRWVQLGLVEV